VARPSAGNNLKERIFMKASSLLVLVAGLGVTLAACGGPGGPPPGDPPDGGPGRQTPPVLSPNAEPLTGGPLGPPRPCAEVLASWGQRVGAAHDGTVSRAAFLADAEAQFARMDLDHDGFITADELSDYREPFRPRPPEGGKGDRRGPPPGGGGGGRGGPGGPGGGGPGGFGGPPGGGGGPSGARQTSANTADPVMSADTNLDFRVSRDEFLRQAEAVFDSLDRDHSGRLDAAKLARFCPAETERR